MDIPKFDELLSQKLLIKQPNEGGINGERTWDVLFNKLFKPELVCLLSCGFQGMVELTKLHGKCYGL